MYGQYGLFISGIYNNLGGYLWLYTIHAEEAEEAANAGYAIAEINRQIKNQWLKINLLANLS